MNNNRISFEGMGNLGKFKIFRTPIKITKKILRPSARVGPVYAPLVQKPGRLLLGNWLTDVTDALAKAKSSGLLEKAKKIKAAVAATTAAPIVQEPNRPIDAVTAPTSGLKTWHYAAIGGGAIGLIGLVILITRRKR